jgi:hypothetical protein
MIAKRNPKERVGDTIGDTPGMVAEGWSPSLDLPGESPRS